MAEFKRGFEPEEDKPSSFISRNILRSLAMYKKVELLILDERFLHSLKKHKARNLLELIENRYKVASTIFCSQFGTPGRHKNFLQFRRNRHDLRQHHSIMMHIE